MDLEKLFENVMDVEAEAEEKMDILPLFQSEFQLFNFCLTKGAVDEFGVFKKSKLELQNRLNSLRSLGFAYDRLKIDIEELKSIIRTSKDKFEKRRREVDLREKLFSLSNLEKTATSIYSEFCCIKNIFMGLYEEFKDKDFNALEVEYWVNKYRQDIKRFHKFKDVKALDELLSSFNSSFTMKLLDGIPGIRVEEVGTDAE
jgi:hypothetical protein